MNLAVASFRGAERRIELWTLALGCGAALLAAAVQGWTTALGLAAGSILAWANFRWVRASVARLEVMSRRQAGAEKFKVPRGVYARLIAVYALLLGLLCATFFSSLIPARAVVAGLFSLVAAVLAEGVYQLTRAWRPGAQ